MIQIDPDNLNEETIQQLTETLAAHGIKFTRALTQKAFYHTNPSGKLNTICVVDTETTGADSTIDKIVELGAILVEYDSKTGNAYRILSTISQLEDPGMPISPEASKVNGITDDMVKGHRINDDEVNAMVGQASIIVCHNSKFDRTFLENRFPVFIAKPFACSMAQINWSGEGLGSSKLEYILYKLGFNYEGHRAVNDCYALLEALQCSLPESGTKALLAMLTKARDKETDLAALNAPFDSKDTLKARKYQWHDVDGVKYWHKAVAHTDVEAEVEWLRSEVYKGRAFSLQQTEVDSYVRYSSRTNVPTVVPYAKS